MAPLPLAGDYNHNGAVDAADYVVWRNNNGPSADYNTWRANFGATAGSGSVLPSAGPLPAVPEPSALVILLTAGLSTLPLTRRLRQMLLPSKVCGDR